MAFEVIPLQRWARSRDMLGMGGIDAAHMLVLLPIVQRLGLGPARSLFDLMMVLSAGGR